MSRFGLLSLAIALGLVGAGDIAAQASPPNVVLIMTDDLGYSDLGVYGATDLDTPAIDRIGAAGVRLTDFYANGVLCSPTRAALITGRYQQRYAMTVPLSGRQDPRGLVVTGNSLPQLMKDAGYVTALVGKWHLGSPPEFSPNAHGFDYFFGFKAGYVDYYTHDRGPDEMDLWENDQEVQVEGYMTDLITERSVRYIEENAERPFFIDVAYSAPHWPYQPPDSAYRSPGRAAHLQPHSENTSTRADYVAMVERVDEGVAEILATLDRLGLAENTLVIFTNDNGGEWLSNNSPFFHRKWTVWEGGIRVPTLIRWPGHIPAGSVSHEVGMTMDLTRTILTAAGARVPDDLDGIDLIPVLSGAEPEAHRTLFWATDFGGFRQYAVRSGDWKLVRDGTATFVYDLRRDSGERNDLARRRQDVARRLHLLLDEWVREVTTEAEQRGLAEGPGLAAAAVTGVSAQAPDSTYANVLALELDRLPSPVAARFSDGYRSRAAALQQGARHVRSLLVDSLGVEPAAVELIVLDEPDWAEVTDRPYGLHTLLDPPPAFLAPAQVDRGIYYDDELPDDDARLGVDVIGLHYLAHFFAAEALYEESTDPPVKWLDELFTVMLQEELLDAVDPALLRSNRAREKEARQLADPRVQTLEAFDREYRGYFVTREGGANYAWFLAGLAEWSRAIRNAHGLEIIAEVRDALRSSGPEMDTPEALGMLESLGVDVGDWR